MAQLPVLTPQTRQFLALSAARAVLSAAFIAIGLTNPVPDRLGGRLELTRQLLRGSPTSDQINHLSPEFRRITDGTSFSSGKVSTEPGQLQPTGPWLTAWKLFCRVFDEKGQRRRTQMGIAALPRR